MVRTFIFGLLLATAGSAAAQSIESGSAIDMTQVSGIIPPVCTVEVTDANVRVEMQTGIQAVTDVTYVCNSAAGLTRRLTSANSGALVRSDQRVPYRLAQVGQDGIAFNDVDLSSPFRDDIAPSAGVTQGVVGRLSLTIPTVPPRLLAGEYSDTITIDITPN